MTIDFSDVRLVTSPRLRDRLGPYRLLSVLGEGGVGRVFLAEHEQLGRRVAIKVLRSCYAANPIVRRRFFQEARSVNQIRHEHIIDIADFVENVDGKSYIVMELLDGETLAQKLLGGPMSVPRLVDIALQTADALGTVHHAGIVHRDLKPENILLTVRAGRGDFVKLLDFGIAKLSDRVAGGKSVETMQGTLIGTPDYMAPEQASGQAIDARTDIYGLGLVMYEMLTGKRPFDAPTIVEKLAKQIREEPIRPSRLNLGIVVPAALEDLILRCLAKHPDDRPATMREVESRLREIAGGLSSAALATLVDDTGLIDLRASRRARSIIWTSAVVAVISAGILAWPLAIESPPPPPIEIPAEAILAEPQVPIEAPVAPVAPPASVEPIERRVRPSPPPKKKASSKPNKPKSRVAQPKRAKLDENAVLDPFK